MTTHKMHKIVNVVLAMAWALSLANVVCILLNLTTAVVVIVSTCAVLVVVLVVLIIWDCVLHRREVKLTHEQRQRNVYQ